MRGKGKCQALHFALLLLLGLGLSGVSASSVESNLVWFADHKTLNAIDVADNSLVQRIDLHRAPDAIAVDAHDGGIWALAHRRLLKFDPAGAILRSVKLEHRDIGSGRARSLALSPYDGTLWVATERALIRLSAEGERLAYWRAPTRIKAFSFDLDESLWVLTQQALLHVSEAGALIESLDLRGHRVSGRHVAMAVDGLGGVIWIGDRHRLLRFQLNHLADPPQVLSVHGTEQGEEGEEGEDHERGKRFAPRHIDALGVHPVFGTLWVATRDQLLMFDRSGVHLRTVDLPTPAQRVNALAFDPRGLGLWVAGKDGLARFSGNGELIATITTEKEAQLLGVAGFTLHPTLAILDPADGARTNNPRSRLRLSLGAQCSGTPCLLPDAYIRSLHLDVELNGEAVGDRFTIAPPEAYYDPEARLPEGANTFSAEALDLFGHRSPVVSSRFTIDTIPPKFVSLSPPDGSTFSKDAIVISGLVDDPTANVILVDAAGSGLSLGNASFSFSTVLKVGLNTFALTARDPAGNETTVPLRVTYNPVRVTITRPTLGAVLTVRGIVVSGEFEGPRNTGLTVNGALAETFGNRFYANLSLEAGSNIITAVATAPGGASASDTVSVSIDVPAADSISLTVEPQSGIAPLTVRFRAENNTPEAIIELAIDTNGDGATDLRIANPADIIEHVYSTPGVYEAQVTATGSGGSTATHTAAIVVKGGAQMDQLFTALWGGMNDALLAGDIVGATAFLNDSAKRKYQPVFEVLKPHFAEIIASYSPLRRISISADIGEYAIVRPYNGKNRLYLIYFLRDANGVWRLDAM